MGKWRRYQFLPLGEDDRIVTGTLWEHNAVWASCGQGFAAYSIKWIIYGLTGRDVSST